MRDDDLARLPEKLRARFAAERDQFHAAGAAAHRRFKVDQLPGLTTQDARRLVEAEGGYFVPLSLDDPDAVMTADIRMDRVCAWIRAGRVESASVG